MSAQELSNETEEWLIGTRAAARSGERAGEEWPLAAIFVSRFANDSEARDFLEFLFPAASDRAHALHLLQDDLSRIGVFGTRAGIHARVPAGVLTEHALMAFLAERHLATLNAETDAAEQAAQEVRRRPWHFAARRPSVWRQFEPEVPPRVRTRLIRSPPTLPPSSTSIALPLARLRLD
jgi:hypothetical protein